MNWSNDNNLLDSFAIFTISIETILNETQFKILLENDVCTSLSGGLVSQTENAFCFENALQFGLLIMEQSLAHYIMHDICATTRQLQHKWHAIQSDDTPSDDEWILPIYECYRHMNSKIVRRRSSRHYAHYTFWP